VSFIKEHGYKYCGQPVFFIFVRPNFYYSTHKQKLNFKFMFRPLEKVLSKKIDSFDFAFCVSTTAVIYKQM